MPEVEPPKKKPRLLSSEELRDALIEEIASTSRNWREKYCREIDELEERLSEEGKWQTSFFTKWSLGKMGME